MLNTWRCSVTRWRKQPKYAEAARVASCSVPICDDPFHHGHIRIELLGLNCCGSKVVFASLSDSSGTPGAAEHTPRSRAVLRREAQWPSASRNQQRRGHGRMHTDLRARWVVLRGTPSCKVPVRIISNSPQNPWGYCESLADDFCSK